jgi:simple sugar transport system ATP-binding protein
MAPILVMEGVNKQYPGVKALDNVTFSVEQGEVRALLGKNGAGKSTLVKILSGAVDPDTGSIRIDGKHWQHTDRRKAGPDPRSPGCF